MGRSRRTSDSIADHLWNVLRAAPVWLGPVMAASVYVLFYWFIPWSMERAFTGQKLLEFTNSILPAISKMIAPWFAGVVIFIWLLAEISKWLESSKFETLNSPDKIRDLDGRNSSEWYPKHSGDRDTKLNSPEDPTPTVAWISVCAKTGS